MQLRVDLDLSFNHDLFLSQFVPQEPLFLPSAYYFTLGTAIRLIRRVFINSGDEIKFMSERTMSSNVEVKECSLSSRGGLP